MPLSLPVRLPVHSGHLKSGRCAQDEEDCPDRSCGGRSARSLHPEEEQVAVLRLSSLCHSLAKMLAEPRPDLSPSKSDRRGTTCAAGSSSEDRALIVKSSSGRGPTQSHAVSGSSGTEVGKACTKEALEIVHKSGQIAQSGWLDTSLSDKARCWESRASNAKGHDHWRSITRMQMALDYRLQRTLLLQQVAADLECQAYLASDR